jgi:hypothetical protein
LRRVLARTSAESGIHDLVLVKRKFCKMALRCGTHKKARKLEALGIGGLAGQGGTIHLSGEQSFPGYAGKTCLDYRVKG